MSNSISLCQLVYDVSRWDCYQWDRFIGQSEAIQSILSIGQEQNPFFPTFAQEVFHRLYNAKPKRLEDRQIRAEAAWSVKAHDQLTQLPEFSALAQRCTGDKTLAGIAATAFLEKVLETLPPPQAPLVDPAPLRQRVKSLIQLQKHHGRLPQELAELLDQLRQQGVAAVQSAIAYAESLDESALRQGFRAACESAQGELDRLEEDLEAFGWGTGPGHLATGASAHQKLQAAQRLRQSPKLQRIAREAGRLKLIAARKQRSKTPEVRSEVSAIEQGNDLAQLLPSELLKLSTPALTPLFYKGFAEKQLLQYNLIGREPQGQGPIVVCLDSSGSMAGRNEIWSKAFALALLSIATRQCRRCRLLHFEESVRRVDDFPANQVDSGQLLTSMEVFFNGGGTNWESALQSALEAIETCNNLKNADIVLITDGLCAVSQGFDQRFSQAKQRLEFTLYGVLIGVANAGSLAAISDATILLNNVAQDGEATRIFDAI